MIYGTIDVPSVIESKSRPGSQGLMGHKMSRHLSTKMSKQQSMRGSASGVEGMRGSRDLEVQPSLLSSGSQLLQISSPKVKPVSNSGAASGALGAQGGKKEEPQLSARKDKPAKFKDVPTLVEEVELTAAETFTLAFASTLGVF